MTLCIIECLLSKYLRKLFLLCSRQYSLQRPLCLYVIESVYVINNSKATQKTRFTLINKISKVLNFIYPEKATIFCKIFPLLLIVKSKGKISQKFVAFSEYLNFKNQPFQMISHFFKTSNLQKTS